MAKILQINHTLRCRRCNGYGFITVDIGGWRGNEQVGEKSCPDCGGDGNNFPTHRLVRGRAMGKKKPSVSLADFEKKVRELIHGRVLKFSMGYNDFDGDYYHEYTYDSYAWHSDGEKAQAIREQNVWRLAIYGRDTGDDGIRFAAATLPALMQMVDQLEIQDTTQHR